jgi:hypothetical protein
MNRLHIAILPLLVLATPAMALDEGASDTDSTTLSVIGNVPAICTGGEVSGGNSTYDLGVLIDTTTGLLRDDLSAPDKLLIGSFCSTRSTIEVSATQMTARNSPATAPAGFSRAVNYVATASGWTETPASFDTAAATNPNASQTQPLPFSGDVTVGIDGFATQGGNALRLVADNEYRGEVVVTLTAAD